MWWDLVIQRLEDLREQFHFLYQIWDVSWKPKVCPLEIKFCLRFYWRGFILYIYIYILQFVHLFGQGNSSLAYALPLTSLACPFDLSCSVSCVVHFVHTQTFPCGRMCRWGWGEIFGSDGRRTTEVKRPRGPSPRNVRSIDCHDARLVQGIAPNVQWTHRARKTSTSIFLTNQLRFCAVCFRFKFDYFFKI